MNPDHLLFTLQDDREIERRALRQQGPGLRRVRAASRSIARCRLTWSRIDAIYNPVRARQLHRRRNPRRPAHRLRPAHGQRRDQRHHHARGRDRLRGRPRAGALPLLRRVRQGADRAARSGRTPARRRRAPGAAEPPHRRLRTLGALAEFAQELEHPHPAGPGRLHRGRAAQGEERGREGRCGKSPTCCAARSSTSGCCSRKSTATCAWSDPGTPPTVRTGADRARRSNAAPAKGRQLSRTSEHRRALLEQHGHQSVPARQGGHHRSQGQGAAALRGEAHHARPARRPPRPPAGRPARSRTATSLARLFTELGPRFAAVPAATPASSSWVIAPETAPMSPGSSCCQSEAARGLPK